MNAYSEFRDALAAGSTPEDVIGMMKDKELTIAEAIKATREILGISLAEAKRQVSCHRRWTAESTAASALHDQIIDVISKLEKGEL